jgi:hypothetical protein
MADLEPGIRLVNAVHFHPARSWAERVRINSGVTIEAGRMTPRDDWRAASAAELALLTASTGDPMEAIALFNIPKRLHDHWWNLEADQDSDAVTKQAAFREYARELIDYLQFKQLPLPARCTVSAVVHEPSLASTKPNAGGLTADPASTDMLAGINLSDEESALVFVNLAAVHLSACSDYPVIRVALQPGEGFWLPRFAIAYDGDTRGRSEIDVQLVLAGDKRI